MESRVQKTIGCDIILKAARLFNMLVLSFVLGSFVSGCEPMEKKAVVQFMEGEFPQRLSDWGVVYRAGDELAVNQGVVTYDLNTPLFTDYAHKLRTIWVPKNSKGSYNAEDDISLPVGSIVTKTFFYPRDGEILLMTQSEANDFSEHGSMKNLNLDNVRLIETRILVHLEDGWHGLPYIWDEQQQDAWLEIAGGTIEVALVSEHSRQSFNYVVPDFNQCQGCHIENMTSGEMGLLGVKTRHLSKNYRENKIDQLQQWMNLGVVQVFELPLEVNVDWRDSSLDINERARSYLDINCGHCHNPKGAADTSGLFLHRGATAELRLGFCKPPVAAGQGTGGRPFGITPGNADESILSYRMKSLNLGAMMPELGRSLVHEEGVALVESWINQLEGEC